MGDDEIMKDLQGTDAERLLLEWAREDSTSDPPPRIAPSGDRVTRDALSLLHSHGLLSEVDRECGGYCLSSLGRDRAKRIQESIDGGPRRQDALDRAILQGLANGDISVPSDLVGRHLPLSDRAIVSHEVSITVNDLLNSELITGDRTPQSQGRLIRLRITEAGRMALEDPRSIRQRLAAGGNAVGNVTVHAAIASFGDGAAIAVGDGSVANSGTITVDQRHQIHNTVEDCLALTPSGSDAVRQALEGIEATANSTMDLQTIRRRILAATKVVTNAGLAAVGTQIATRLLELLQTLA